VVPNIRFFSSVIKAYGKRGDLNNILKVMEIIKVENLEPDAHIYGILMDTMAKMGKIDKMIQCFNWMKEAGIQPNAEIFHMIINAMARRKRMPEAIEWFNKMKSSGISPNVKSFTILVQGFGHQGDMKLANEFINQMIESNIEIDMRMICSLMEIYAKNGDVTNMVKYFNFIPKNSVNVLVYNILIGGFNRARKYNLSSRVFGHMLKQGLIPNEVTFTNLVNAYGFGNQVNQIEELVKHMKTTYKLKPNLDVYIAIIGAYTKSRKLKKVIEIYEEMEDRKIDLTRKACSIFLDLLFSVDIPKDTYKLWESLKSNFHKDYGYSLNSKLSDDEIDSFYSFLESIKDAQQ